MKDQELTPLRIVLQNFLNHIETLESKSCDNSYESEFQHLKNFSESVKGLKLYSCSEGEKDVNRKKNRYKDILPFDVSRVVLNEYAGVPGSDYINANFIKGASGSPAYIACQGPLPNTVNDFWRMVVQCEVQVIVMACNEEEAGKTKCEKYWVDDSDEKVFGGVSVKLLKSSTVCTDFSVRTMRLKYKNSQSVMEERTVCQLHYVAWPDHGVPSVVQPLLDMVRLVRDTQASETLPVLVHCSAGCGRTGTICAIDYVWGLLRTGKLTKDFSLLGLIREMRRQRIAMVQTKEQYVLVHHAVRELFKEQLNMIDSHPYENIDLNGMLKDCASLSVSQDSEFSLSEEESSDMQREDLIVPPLPERPRSFFTSKQEKEVENLNAQQKFLHPRNHKNTRYHQKNASEGLRSTEHIIDMKRDHSLFYDNATLKDLLLQRENNKVTLMQPINTISNNPVLSKTNVKRSKSLKALTYGKDKLSLYSVNGIAKERRPSLESNYEELISSLNISEPAKKSTSTSSPSNLTSKPNVPVDGKASRSDKLSVRDYKKPLVRSHTTLEFSHRPYQYVEDNGEVKNYERYKKPINYKFIRSRTHINLERPLESQPKPLSMSKSVRYSSEKNPRVVNNGDLRSYNSNPFKKSVNNVSSGCPPLKTSDKQSPGQHVYLESPVAKESKPLSDHSRSFEHDMPYEGSTAVNSSEPVISVNQSPIRLQKIIKPSNSQEKYPKLVGPPPSSIRKDTPPKGNFSVNGILKSPATRNPSSRELAERVPSHYLSSPLNKHIDKHTYMHYDRKNIPEMSSQSKSSSKTPINHHSDVMKQSMHGGKEYSRLSFPPGKVGLIEGKGIYLQGFRPRRKLPSEETISDTDSSAESKNLSLPIQYAEKKDPPGHQIENSPSVRLFYEDKFLRKGKRSIESKSDPQKNCYSLYANPSLYTTPMEGSVYSKHAILPCSMPSANSPRYPFPPMKQKNENPGIKYDDTQEPKQFYHVNHQELISGTEQIRRKQYSSPRSQNDFECAPGIDLDKVAASITEKDGSKSKFMKAALDSLHLRKSRESIEKNGSPSKNKSPSVQPSGSASSSKKKSHHQYI